MGGIYGREDTRRGRIKSAKETKDPRPRWRMPTSLIKFAIPITKPFCDAEEPDEAERERERSMREG